MHRRLLLSSILTVVCTGLAPSRGAAPADAPPTFPPEQVEFFEKQIRPVLVKSCVECHGPKLQEGGLRLDSRTGVLKGIEGHPAAVPGDPGRSTIIAVTKYDGDVQMPPDGKLPDEQLAALTNWVKMGLPWPEDAAAASAPATSTDAKPAETPWGGSMPNRIARARAEHWAFQPVRKPQPPTVADPAWMQNPIDRFVYAKLAEAGLQPSPAADPRTLIRRVTFDLLGLPPAPEEVETFVSSVSPSPALPLSHSGAEEGERGRGGEGQKVYEALIDQLLASPHYGERWARHWLDVARYADTKGYAFQQERRFPFAYTYRDYVIRAFNADKPYDQFIIEQLAADKLPPTSDKSNLAALGFITCGRQYQGLHDTLDDQIDVVTRGLLGLTASCARCHDHKFDPIPTDDYYSLYGVFRSTVEPGELPLLGEPVPSPEYEAFKTELAKLTKERDEFVNEQMQKLVDEIRSRTTDYLAKVIIERDKSSSKEVFYLFDEGDPRPTVVRRWREFLSSSKRKPDAVFRAWHAFDSLKEPEFADKAPAVAATLLKERDGLNHLVAEAIEKQPPKSMLDVAKLYGALFERIEADWKKLQNPDSRKPNEPAPTALPDAAAEQLRQILYRLDAPPTLNFDEARKIFDRKVRDAVEAKEKKIDQLVVTSPGAPPRAMSVADAAKPFDPVVFVRGDAARPGKHVPRQFLEVIAGADRKPFADGSGRLELARAIASRDNPLTARVMVNRIWQQHFGRGLVDTPSDFGVRTPPPSHPELLDYLAAEFMDEGWSIKRLQRLIVTSKTYRQASAGLAASLATRATAVDPENRLLWKMNRRRLELEPMRDAMLAVAGKLDTTALGRPVDIWKEPFSGRRTVYGFIDRQDLPGVFAVFDFASPDVTIDQRPRTSVPQQALFAMNSPFVQQQAEAVVARPEMKNVSDSAARIETLYRLILERRPTPDELARVRQYIDAAAAAPPVVETWEYGYGEYDPKLNRMASFATFKHWTGKAWQAGPAMPDPKLSYLMRRSDSAHPGRNASQAVVARWTSPLDGAVVIAGVLKHANKDGDGVLARIVSSKQGQLGEWPVHNKTVETKVPRFEVRRGDVIDFVVEPRGSTSFDAHSWSPTIARADGGGNDKWDLAADFHGPNVRMDAWETLAQVLLMSNEFMFVD